MSAQINTASPIQKALKELNKNIVLLGSFDEKWCRN